MTKNQQLRRDNAAGKVKYLHVSAHIGRDVAGKLVPAKPGEVATHRSVGVNARRAEPKPPRPGKARRNTRSYERILENGKTTP